MTDGHRQGPCAAGGASGPAPPVVGSVRKLRPGEQAHLTGHLLRLTAEDRRMRFCGRVDDASVLRHASAPGMPSALRLGDFENGWMRGCAELHLFSRSGLVRRAELALSVEGAWQHRGIGTRLTDEVMILARNRALDSVHMQWPAGNAPMHALARSFHARA